MFEKWWRTFNQTHHCNTLQSEMVAKAAWDESAKQFHSLAGKIQKREHWFIGGFLAEVIEEWGSKSTAREGKEPK